MPLSLNRWEVKMHHSMTVVGTSVGLQIDRSDKVSHAAINLLRDIDRFVADIFSTPSTKPTNFFYCFVSL